MKPVILIILDGYGLAPPGPGNAIQLANPININSYLYSYPNTTLKASGQSVGLPPEEAGNTEVGHLNIGAGRVVYQDLPRINMSIADGNFYKNKAFLKVVNHLKQTGGDLHLIGLIAGENSIHVHANIEHLYALLYFAKENHIEKVYIHVITDGRDSPPKSAETFIGQFEEKIKEMGIGQIATIMGRYYAMDRDRRWDRTAKAYFCLTQGRGNQENSAKETIVKSYGQGLNDEFILPTNIVKDGKPISLIKENDALIFFNFRIDRPRQLTKAFVLDDFKNQGNASLSFDPYATKYYKTHYPQEQIVMPPFDRGEKIKNLLFVTMTQYENDLKVEVAFPPLIVQMPLGRVVAEAGMAQLRLTESEKERFVTFYFNGQREAPFPLEDRLIIPSPKVATYDMKPEMSAYELTNILLAKMREEKYKLFVVNYPNPDMVGHTGNIQATIKAIKTVDKCLGKVVEEAMILNFTVIITADHGNAEQKINLQTGDMSTEHTTNPVPFIFIDNKYQDRFTKLQSGILADIAPTILRFMGINKPDTMTGRDLLEEFK